jgi:hypothetical protein
VFNLKPLLQAATRWWQVSAKNYAEKISLNCFRILSTFQEFLQVFFLNFKAWFLSEMEEKKRTKIQKLIKSEV